MAKSLMFMTSPRRLELGKKFTKKLYPKKQIESIEFADGTGFRFNVTFTGNKAKHFISFDYNVDFILAIEL